MATGLHKTQAFPFHSFILSKGYFCFISLRLLCSSFFCYLWCLPASSRRFFRPCIGAGCRRRDAWLCLLGSGRFRGRGMASEDGIGPLRTCHGGLLENRNLFACLGECVGCAAARFRSLHSCIFGNCLIKGFHLLILRNFLCLYFCWDLNQVKYF